MPNTLLSIDPTYLADGTICALGIAYGVLQFFSRRNAKKSEDISGPEDELEVITKSDFMKLNKQMADNKVLLEEGVAIVRKSTNDSLSCIIVINTLITVLATNPPMLKKAADEVYQYLRHADDFGSKITIQTILEIAVRANEK